MTQYYTTLKTVDPDQAWAVFRAWVATNWPRAEDIPPGGLVLLDARRLPLRLTARVPNGQ